MDKRNTKQTLVIKLVCVLLSFGLWLYITNIQSPIRTYTLKDVSVKLLNTQSLKQFGLAISPKQTFTVDLSLEGDAKDIYSVTKDQFSLTADLGEYALKTGINNIPVQVVNYPEELNIKNNGNLVIKVKLEKLITKDFNTVSKVKVNYAQGVYKQKEQFTSEKVEVSGPQSSVDKVANVALVGDLNNVSGSVTKEFPLKALDADGDIVEGVTLSKETGTIAIDVNNGKSVDLKTEYTGQVPKGYKLVSTTPSRTSVQIVGNENIIASINSVQTEKVDLSDIRSNTEKKVKIILPKGVSLASGDNYITVNIVIESENSNNQTPSNKITKVFDVPVNYTGINSEFEMSNETKTIKVTVQGDEADINNMKASDFVCNFDLSKFKNEGSFEEDANVTMANSNPNVTISNADKVKFTLKKKSASTTTDQNKDKENGKKTV
ncbi:CdaR family protein [Clostridium sardiniense]|uniref:CdaR family protein n=1 Tax=Clostridium sardiniense TaxID=29369 RepID=UPI00195DA225|nr:CdaR family protein [Clostridium sardiniense]MBM7835440.1 YbbR domain-containing protein [Clostridium sardiniense]